MRKNLKSLIEVYETDEPQILLDMNDEGMQKSAGLTPNAEHTKEAERSALWAAGRVPHVAIPTGGIDLSTYRFLTFSVWATGMIDKTFRLTFDNSPAGEGKNGYTVTLRIVRDGWTEFSVELPFLHGIGEPEGWSRIESVNFDRVGEIGASAQICIDSLFVYRTQPAPLFTRMPELKGAALFSTTGAFSIVDRKRIPNAVDGAPARPFEAEGTLWVPMGTVAAGIAHTPIADNRALTLSFTYRRKKYAFEAARRYMTEDGKRVSLSFAPRAEHGTLFFPVEFVCEFFRWRQIFTDPMGLIVLSNRRGIFRGGKDQETVRALIADLTFLRPDGERILSDLRRRFTNPTRGRLFLSYEELMQLRRDVKEKPQLKEYLGLLKEQYGVDSEAFRSVPLSTDAPQADAADFLVASDRLLAFSLLYRVTGDKRFCERVALEAEGLGTFTDWCTANLSTLGSVCLSMAIAYDWCHHMWSEARKAVVERAMLRNGMRVGLDYYDGKRKMWLTGGATAAAVGAGMLALALALCDIYPETALKLVGRIPRNIEPCFAAFAPDGGYAEGHAAWEKSFRSLSLIVAMLERACGEDYGYFRAPGFSATAYFPLTTETKNGVWNYHNSAAVGADTSMFFWLCAHTGDPTPAWMRRQQILAGRKRVNPFDLLFFNEVDDSMEPHLPLDSVWRGAALAAMRAGWGEEDLFIGLHGGDNACINGDLDAGSVILDAGGVRFFAETGGIEALPVMLRRRAAGQNTIVVNPAREPAPDQRADAVAPLSVMRSSMERAYAVVDMKETSRDILRASRGVMLTENRTVAVIQDEIVTKKDSTFVWTVYTPASVTPVCGGKAVKLEKDGKILLCKLGGVSAKFETEAVEGCDLTRLCIRVKGKSRLRLSVACRLMMDGDSVTDKLYETTPMSKW